MQKNKKRSENNVRRAGLQFPDVINVDDLAVMTDEDLVMRLRSLEDDRRQAVEAAVDGRPWEDEIAYIRREQQIRRTRRETYSEYVRLMEEEFARIEAALPAGDFDNSAYVYAATGGKPPRWS